MMVAVPDVRNVMERVKERIRIKKFAQIVMVTIKEKLISLARNVRGQARLNVLDVVDLDMQDAKSAMEAVK